MQRVAAKVGADAKFLFQQGVEPQGFVARDVVGEMHGGVKGLPLALEKDDQFGQFLGRFFLQFAHFAGDCGLADVLLGAGAEVGAGGHANHPGGSGGKAGHQDG